MERVTAGEEVATVVDGCPFVVGWRVLTRSEESEPIAPLVIAMKAVSTAGSA